jgi:hypothetical protein
MAWFAVFITLGEHKIPYSKSTPAECGVKAKLHVHKQTPQGPKEKTITVKNGADLFALTNERANYAQGYSVSEINAEPGNQFIRFSNRITLKLGNEKGGMRDDLWRVQIKHTIKKHLDKELQLRARGIKVLSLFFIDRVANYRDYNEAGQSVQGKFAEVFEAELATLAKEERYSELAWLREPIVCDFTIIPQSAIWGRTSEDLDQVGLLLRVKQGDGSWLLMASISETVYAITVIPPRQFVDPTTTVPSHLCHFWGDLP